jgi:cytochrome c biogenesis protein CcmG, thiol:disulfide interchange protein DsbE
MRTRLLPWKLAIGATVVLASSALVMGLLLSTGDGTVPAAAEAPAADREQAPELEGDWIVPPPMRLAELRGTPVVINFWASWCVPCRAEAPELARFAREMGTRAHLVGVDFQDAKADALAFIREFQWRFPNVRDPRGKLAGRYKLAGLPTTYVIDTRGRIARSMTGAQTFETLVRAVGKVEG